MTLPEVVHTGLVGTTFVRGYPANIRQLELMWGSCEVHERQLRAVLIRNPDNEHDPNAVEVHVLTVGMLGHLPAALAARISPDLDAGQRWRCYVEQVKVRDDHPDHPGVELRLVRVAKEAAA